MTEPDGNIGCAATHLAAVFYLYGATLVRLDIFSRELYMLKYDAPSDLLKWA